MIKKFNKFTNKIYYFSLLQNGHEGFNLYQINTLSKKLIDIFNSQNIIFKTYFYLTEDSNINIIFIFDFDISNIMQKLDIDIKIEEIDEYEVISNLNDFLVPDNNIENYIIANKYNL